MAYVSLYRKYRPQTFAEVVGQTHVTTTLGQAVAEDRVHHAYLFTGPRGTGKTSTARILAKSLNCESGPTAEPCNACTHCVAITAGSSVDVIEIDAASHGGVDDVRDLRDRVAFAPASARTKVYIVDECHMLSTAGWNAFLKTVEEPPGHVVFVFATTEPHKVLDTILSRTQRFDFKRVGAADLAGHVSTLGQAEGMEFEPGAVELVVRAGDGSVRDTLSVLDQVVAFTGAQVTAQGVADVLGAVPEELLIEVVDHVAAGDVAGLCVLVGRLADAGHDLRQFAREAVEHLRTLFLLQAAPDAGLVEATPERLARLLAQSGRMGQVDLLRAVELLADAQAQMRRGSIRLPLEVALIKAALPEAAGDPAALAARIDRLERRADIPATTPSPAPAGPEGPPRQQHAPATQQRPGDGEAPAAPGGSGDGGASAASGGPGASGGSGAPGGPGDGKAPAAPGGSGDGGASAASGGPGVGKAPAAPAEGLGGWAGERPGAGAAVADTPTQAKAGADTPTQAKAGADTPTQAKAGADTPTQAKAGADTQATRDEAGAETQATPDEGGAGSPATDVDLDLVQRSWPAILEATKARKRTLHAFLTEGQPVAVEGNRLTLRFRPRYAFHAEQCAEDQAQANLGAVFEQVLGVAFQVRCVLADSDEAPTAAGGHSGPGEQDEATAVAEAEAAEAAGELPDEQQAHDAAVQTLSRDLGATVVEE